MKSSKMNNIRVIISGGGTGGHIFPAIAIADGLKKFYPNVEILFVGANGKMEMEKVPAAGYDIVGLNVEGLSRSSMLKNVVVMAKFALSVVKAMGIIRRFKPALAIGVGGYASGALLKAAGFLRVPYLIQEQNSFPGKTNLMLGKKAKAICVAFPDMEKFFDEKKLVMSGNPIRKDFVNLKMKDEKAYEFFGIEDKSKLVILIVGGSQGAMSINKAIAAEIQRLVETQAHIIWQVGKNYINEAKALVSSLNLEDKVWVSDFIYRMDYAYSVADLVITRAGAIAASEICAVGLPAIFVPLPTAAENHQMKNALSIAENNAALIVEDKDLKEKLYDTICECLNNSVLRMSLSKNIKTLSITNAVDRIVDVVDKQYIRIMSEEN